MVNLEKKKCKNVKTTNYLITVQNLFQLSWISSDWTKNVESIKNSIYKHIYIYIYIYIYKNIHTQTRTHTHTHTYIYIYMYIYIFNVEKRELLVYIYVCVCVCVCVYVCVCVCVCLCLWVCVYIEEKILTWKMKMLPWKQNAPFCFTGFMNFLVW